MIASITGTAEAVEPGALVVNAGGIGYLVYAPSSVLTSVRVGEQCRLLTEMVVREDALTLYGFQTTEQRDWFRYLTAVTGVGPKLALAVLSSFAPASLVGIVRSGDVDSLTTVPGVGRRSAQRMLLELKQRLAVEVEEAAAGSTLAEARDALAHLGYSPTEIREALERVPAGDESRVEDLVRTALKELSRV